MPVRLKIKREQPKNNNRNGNQAGNGEVPPPRATHRRMLALADESRRLRLMTIAGVAVFVILIVLGIVSLAKAPPAALHTFKQPPRPPARPGAVVSGQAAPNAHPGTAPPAAPAPADTAMAAVAPPPAPAQPQDASRAERVQIPNGDFESGNMQGWTPSGMAGGGVQMVQAGTVFPGQIEDGRPATDTDQIPFQQGQWAVCMRSSGPGAGGGAAAILTSVPVKISKSWLRWDEMAESEMVTTEVHVIDAQTGMDLAIQRFTRSRPRSTRNDVFWERQSMDMSRYLNRTVQIQFRQTTADGGNGWFTLLDNIALE